MSTPDETEYQKGDRGTIGEMTTNLTPGVKNIQAAYSRAGATNHHTPGAASKLGSQEQHGRKEASYVAGESKEPSAIGQLAKDMMGSKPEETK